MAKATRQNPFGSGPRLGNSAPGEPANTPNAGNTVEGFGGAPTVSGIHNRGHKAVNPNGASEVFPAPYGGGEAFTKRPNQKPAKGSGANVGAGTVTGNQVP